MKDRKKDYTILFVLIKDRDRHHESLLNTMHLRTFAPLQTHSLFCFFFLILFAPASLRSQTELPRSRVIRIERLPELKPEEEPRSHLISVNPIKLLAPFEQTYLHLYYHHALPSGFIIGAGIQTPNILFEEDISGVGIHPEAEYAFGSDPFKGFFVGGGAAYDYLSVSENITGTDSVHSYSDNVFSVRTFAGYYIEAVEKGFTTAIIAGGEFNIAPATDPLLGTFSDKKGLVPYLSVRMGYAW